MTHIPAHDHGALYVFSVDGEAPAGLTDKADAALMALLGNVLLNTDYVDVITPDMLADMPLSELIQTGYDLPIDTETAGMLQAVTGPVVLVMSAAFGGQETTLTLSHATLITTLREAAHETVPRALHAQSAKGAIASTTRSAKSDARIGGMVATVALLLMFLLVGVMVWIGG
jgi:hypothetical protein